MSRNNHTQSITISHWLHNVLYITRVDLFRSEIDDGGAEISSRRHFSAGAALTVNVPVPKFSSESGAARRDRGQPVQSTRVMKSDVKHVTKLVGYSDGPGVVIAAHTRRWDVIWGA